MFSRRLWYAPWKGAILVVLLSLANLLTTHSDLLAYTPQSSEVLTMRSKAVAYLEKCESHNRLGGNCLVAMAIHKELSQDQHPKVLEAIEACRQFSADKSRKLKGPDVYSVGIAIIFLCGLDPAMYRTEIEDLLAILESLRKPNIGAWGYPDKHGNSCDTSMTQYGVLCYWAAHEAGFQIEFDAAAACCNWLLRTQDPSGAWSYQGKDSGSEKNLIAQDQLEIRHSLAAAGLSSVYIMADLLSLAPKPRPKKVRTSSGAVRPVEQNKQEKQNEQDASDRNPRTTKVSKDRVRAAMALGDRWFDNNFAINEKTPALHYYMYALERYQSFREKVTGEEQLDWYDTGVTHLVGTQKEDGSWQGKHAQQVDTSFAVLFLLRSTQKTIKGGQPQTGFLISGHRIPRDTTNMFVRNGRIEAPSRKKATDEVLAMLLRTDESELRSSFDLLEELELSQNPEQRATQIAKLQRLLRAGEQEKRLIAIKTFTSTRDLDQIPALIYALSDPDFEIKKLARDGLRFMSRKFYGYGLVDEPDEGQEQAAILNWKKWYLSIKPDAEFWN